MLKKIIIVIAVLVLGLQFFRGSPPEVRNDNPDDLLDNYEVRGEVAGMLRTACYDCHSMETIYPWYSYITPVSWSVFDHVRVGRDELNFSDWNTLEKRKKIRKLKDVAEEVEKMKMPMEPYMLMHGDAQLSDDQREIIINWANDLAKEVMKE